MPNALEAKSRRFFLTAFAQAVVGNHNIGNFQPCNIKRFARRGADNAVLSNPQKCWQIPYAYAPVKTKSKWISSDTTQYMVINADAANLFQLLPGPNPANGIMRAAQNQHFIFRILRFFSQIVKVDPICMVFINQRVVDQFPTVLSDGHGKRRVYRLHDNDPVAWFGKSFDNAEQRIDYAGSLYQPIRFNFH